MNILKHAGLDFDSHKRRGIDPIVFAEYFLSSGLVFNPDVTWICFQGNQDFGYMYRNLANTLIPDSEDRFLDDLKIYFPNLYDIKFMKHEFENLRGGLSRLGDILCLDRIGQQHQAGSDSWLTGLAFFKLAETYLNDKDLTSEYNNVLYGLGPSINDEQYLDNYTSKTEQLEREERDNQEMADDYMHQNYYPYHPPSYYGGDMYHPHPMGFVNNDMDHYGNEIDHYSYQGHHLMHPTPIHNNMGYNSMSPNIPHPGYGMSPNHMGYNNED
jgi:hypothetical protein